MAFSSINTADITAGKPVDEDLLQNIKDNDDYLYGAIGTARGEGIPNSTLSIDTDTDGYPDNWTWTPYAGGSGAIISSTSAYGPKCFSIVHPGGAGNGGGYIDSDYLECSEYLVEILSVMMWDTASARNKVDVLYYDKDQVYLSTLTLYDGTTLISTPTLYQYRHVPPASARYMKVRLSGGVDTVDSAGTTYFGYVDRRTCRLPDYVAGAYVFHIDARQFTHNNTSFYSNPKQSIKITRNGSLRIGFDLWSSSGASVEGRLAKNGSPIGTLRSTTSTTPVTYTEDITGLKAGDFLHLYIRVVSGGIVYTENFTFQADNPII